jgi:ATP-dependent RNA helicase DeaD
LRARTCATRQQVTVEREVVAEGEVARVRQVAYIVSRAHKMPALARVLDIEQPTSAIVFCRTRTEVDELSETLTARGCVPSRCTAGCRRTSVTA